MTASTEPDRHAADRHAADRRIAILIVNGFRRRGRWARFNLDQALKYPWIGMCLDQIERHSQGWDYQVFVFDNSHLTSHRALMRKHARVRVSPPGWVAVLGRIANRLPFPHFARLLERSHPGALDYLARKVANDFDYIVTLDNDSFPVRDDWLEVLVGQCERGAAISGVHRNEMAPAIAPFIHVSGLCVRPADLLALKVSFGEGAQPDIEHNQDVGQRITYEFTRRGRTIAPLERSNALNIHFLMGAIYGDVIYHHGAGSRKGKFWTSTDRDTDDRANAALRDAAFTNLVHLIAVLRGEVENDLGLEPV
jgi:hypothetical protein